MAFLNFFKSGKAQPDKNKASKVFQESSAEGGSMAADGLSGTAENIFLNPQETGPQILVVGTENFSKNLVEYALKMAKRLDCQIIAVNATTPPPTLPDEQRQHSKELFFKNAAKAGALFSELADSISVSLTHLMEIGTEEHIIHDITSKNPGIRYVLTEPKLKDDDDPNAAQIPVFDLACSRK